MLSRRRRVTLDSCRSSIEIINDDRKNIVINEIKEKSKIDEITFSSSTETPDSGIGRLDFRFSESENRHVESDNLNDERRWIPLNKSEFRTTDRVIKMINFNQNFRRLSSRIIENSRRRRRKITENLENHNDTNFRYNRRITNEPSSLLTIVNNNNQASVNPNVCTINRIATTYDFSTIISERVDSLTDSSSMIKDETSSTKKLCRVRNGKINDFVKEHKNRGSRRREIGTTRTENAWRTRKNRFFIVFGLLMWCMIIPEIAGRQSHHRTCPGCPHQHVHAINRKAGTETGTESTGSTENAPSPDDLRLEAIKHQILTKLGLRSRPDVNRTLASVPRHLALETLYRAEAQPSGHQGDRDGYHESRRRDHHRDLENDDDSSSSYGQFYYAGEEYSYRNVDPGVIGKDDSSGGRENDDASIRGSSNERHRDFGDDDSRHGNDADQDSQVEMDDFYARTSEIITFAEPGRTLNGQPLLEFPRSSGDPALEPLRIKRATLWARVELRHAHHYQHHRRAQSNQRNITLWVFRVRCGNVTHLRGKELGEHLEMVTSLGVNVNQLGWQKFDVTRVVSNWYSGREPSSTRNEKLTLLVDCTGCGSHVHVSTFGVQSPNVVESLNAKGGQDPDRPFLVVRTDPAAVKRVRRRAIECSGAIKGQCCKQRFYVSFSQLGWDDWIIAPQGYYANYCRGDCAAGHRTPDTFLNYYTHVIEEYRKMDRLAGMQPCCAPLKFSPMSLIYYGPDSNIIKRDLPKMVVDECGCP